MALRSDLLISLYVVFMFMATCLAVRVAVDISWMPEPSKPDRALSSLLISILVLQRKFSAEVDVKLRRQLAENGDTSGLVSCEDVECLQASTKQFIGEELDGKGLKVLKDTVDHNFANSGKYDVHFLIGKKTVPQTQGVGSTLNLYFLSYEHQEKRHPPLHFFQPKEKEDIGEWASNLATFDCIFIPSPVVHDVFLMGVSGVFRTCRERGLMCPTVMTHNVAGHMYHHGHGAQKGGGEIKDIRQNKRMKDKLVEGITTIVWRYMQQSAFRDTVKRLYPIYRSYPISALGPGSAPSLHTALIVEPTLNAFFEFAVRTTVRQLSVNSRHTWTLRVLHSEANERYVKDCLKDLHDAGKVTFELVPVSVHVVAEYNQMTKHVSFWERYKAPGSKVLLFQSDTVLLGNSTSIDEFLTVDYVGAPWHNQWNDRLNELRAQPGGYFKAGVGNGGLSLRSGDVMHYIAAKAGELSPVSEQEDLFYVKQIEMEQRSGGEKDDKAKGMEGQGKYAAPAPRGQEQEHGHGQGQEQSVPRPSSFVVADRELAWKFAYEVKCEDQAGKSNPASSGWKPPLGLHAAWYYWGGAEMAKLLDYL